MDENKEKPGERLIKVERGNISFGKEFEKKYGNFVFKTNNAKAGQVKEFTLDDIELIGTPHHTRDGYEAAIIKMGYVPVDAFCAQAMNKIITDNNNYDFALLLAPKLPFTNIVFLGSVLNKKNERTPETNYYVWFEYDYFGLHPKVPKLICSFENPGSSLADSVIAVFKKSFFNKDQSAETADQIKELPKETLTLEELYIKQIRSLREKNVELQKKYDELLEKYKREIQKISKPQLTTETIELLCKRVCDFNLSARVINATDSYKIIYLFQLISMSKAQLGRVRNIYKKSIKEIEDFVSGLGQTLGMNFSPEEYNYFWEKIEEKIAAK